MNPQERHSAQTSQGTEFSLDIEKDGTSWVMISGISLCPDELREIVEFVERHGDFPVVDHAA